MGIEDGEEVRRPVHGVILIGGGPAGSTAAGLLARRGYDVRLFKRERFPREHAGEFLLPFRRYTKLVLNPDQPKPDSCEIGAEAAFGGLARV